MNEGEVPDRLPELEVRCERCGGEGGVSYSGGRVDTCYRCHGAGHIPTDFGERVLALMQHHFRPMLTDALAALKP